MTNATEAEWILKTMAAMAAADRRLDAREVRLIQEVYEEQTALPVDVSGVMTAIQTYAKRDVLEDLSTVAGGLSPETKEAIVRGAYLALVANEHISENERQKLEAIATVLGIAKSQLETVLDQAASTDLSCRTFDLVGRDLDLAPGSTPLVRSRPEQPAQHNRGD